MVLTDILVTRMAYGVLYAYYSTRSKRATPGIFVAYGQDVMIAFSWLNRSLNNSVKFQKYGDIRK